ncbi:hypothetical protein C2S51_001635 [Perilla frutescens var. frutescens]|nr:hypothetical protein C2S51_001635 [Perilla frutescens var. frutescens]
MGEIVVSFVGPAIEVVKWIGAPIIRQFNYLCCFTTNMATLKHEAEELEDAAAGLQGKVDSERDNVQIIIPEVETWIKNSNDIKDLKNTILNEVPNVESGCLNLRDRFSLSKRAKKTTGRIKELRDRCNFNVIAHPRPLAAAEAVPLGMTYEFESRKQIEEDIMTRLRDGDVNMIGICGMGGVGKTTMARMIMNRALQEQVFEEVVMAVVSQTVDKWKIHVEIGGPLGLKNLKEEASMANRVQMLHARLTEGKKRILLVLDDVWERLVLEELGIPCGSKKCTILLTSRNSDVLSAMGVEKVFGMEVLSEEDAWLLFRGRAGTCVDDTRLNSIANEVVKECKGLPIALTTVGSALKDEKNKGIWKDASRQLRKANPTNIPYFIKEVYNPLKVSYNKLDSEEAKCIFLLCCLFDEDADISLEKLTYFSMGLGVFEGGMEEARDWMCALTKMLKSRSLLLDDLYDEDCVRMHDVVRDVCIFIAKQEGYIGHNDCTWLSSSFQQGARRTKLSTNLRLLFLTRNSEQEEVKFDKSFVEGIKDLHVLCIEKYSFTSLPHSTPSLKNLNTLMLYSCRKLETLSVVGELVNLEVLICRHCSSIKELPHEIKGLNRLKSLDLSECGSLERIGEGIISSLVGLEELKMLWSFNKWEACDRKERQNAGLRELESLINLRCLEIQIEDPALAAENMRLSSKLERFQIIIDPFSSSQFDSYSSNNKLSLQLEGGSCVGDWIEMQLLKDTECLCLSGDGANNVDYLANSENIRWLELGMCETVKTIGRTSSSMHNDGDASVFPSIDHLELFSLPDLKEICDGPISSNSFQNLKELLLTDLPALKQLWKSDSTRQLSTVDCLPQLEVLEIEDCEMMEQVFLWNEEDDQNINNRRHITKVFPKLKKVELHDLPNLITFCEGIEGIEFPLLTRMWIQICPKMTSMVSSNENNSGGRNNTDNIDDHHSLHLFCRPQKVSSENLKELSTHWNPFSCGHKIDVSLFIGLEIFLIHECEGSTSLFSPSIARNLVSLKELRIGSCVELVEVIRDDEEEKGSSGDGQRTLLFPKLRELELKDLQKLVSFCEWKCDIELPSLRQVYISHCPHMKNFSSGLLTTPNMLSVIIDFKHFYGVKDLNDRLQQCYLAQDKLGYLNSHA